MVMDELMAVGKRAATCVAGSEHTVILMRKGGVYSWGNNTTGQLGGGASVERSSMVPVAGKMVEKTVFKLGVCGTNNTILLSDDGVLYGCGDNLGGQLGVGDKTSRFVFTKVETLSDVTSVCTYHRHTVACTADGALYCWGVGRWEVDEHHESTKPLSEPSRVVDGPLASEKVVAVANGGGPTMTTTADGSLWKWTAKAGPVQVELPGRCLTAVAGLKHWAVVVSKGRGDDDERKE